MSVYLQAFHKTNGQYFALVGRAALGIFATIIFCEVMAQYFLFMEARVGHTQMGLISTTFGKLSVALTKSLVFVMLIPLKLKELDNGGERGEGFWSFAKRQVMPLTIEGLRVITQVIFGLLLLIVPGIQRQVRLFFVPFVVMFDPRYANGEIDALKTSTNIVMGSTWSLAIFLVIEIFVELSMEQFKQSFNVVGQAPIVLLLSLIIGLIVVYLYAYMFRLYEAFHARALNGTKEKT